MVILILPRLLEVMVIHSDVFLFCFFIKEGGLFYGNLSSILKFKPIFTLGANDLRYCDEKQIFQPINHPINFHLPMSYIHYTELVY